MLLEGMRPRASSFCCTEYGQVPSLYMYYYYILYVHVAVYLVYNSKRMLREANQLPIIA